MFVLCRNWAFFWCLRNYLLTARKHPRACPEMSHQSQMSGEKDFRLCHQVKFLKCQFEGYRGVAVGVGLLANLGDGLSTVLKRQDCEQKEFLSFLCSSRCSNRMTSTSWLSTTVSQTVLATFLLLALGMFSHCLTGVETQSGWPT